MKKMIIIIVLLILTIFTLMSLLISSDTKDSEHSVEYLIGVSQCNLGEPWRVQMNADIIEAMTEYDNVRMIFKDAAQSNEKQEEDVKTLIDLGIDLLIISPNEAEPLTKIVEYAYEKVPVIVLDRGVYTDKYTLFIGANNYEIGYKAGESVYELSAGNRFNIVEIAGLAGAEPTIKRHDGFMDAILKYDNINVVQTLTADWLRDKAEDEFLKYLYNNQNIDIVYAHNDPMAFGAYSAMKKTGHEGIMFIGIDGLKGENGGIDLVNKGILKSTFIYPTGGIQAVEYAIRILNGEEFAEKRIELKSIQIK